MKKILVVDDDPGILEILRIALERAEYEVLTAMTGEDALSLAKSEQPNVILLDMLMPGMDGEEIYRQLRGGKETAAIPVIAISGSEEQLEAARSIMDEASSTLLKTEGIKALLKRIEGFLAED